MGPQKLEEAARRARALGAQVEIRGRTGDLTFFHSLAGTVRTSSNNRDATKRVARFIRRLEHALFLESLRDAVHAILVEQQGQEKT